MIDVSIVVPLYNEVDSLRELAQWVDRVVGGQGLSYELIFVDDGSTDGSWEVVESLSQESRVISHQSGYATQKSAASAAPQTPDSSLVTHNYIHGIRFARNYGKSAALYAGFEAARGEVVVTMDADLQDSPDEIPELRRMIVEDGYDLVSGWKKHRHDPVSKRWPSKFFNFTTRLVSGIRLHDMNCGLKAYRRNVVKSIEVYGEMHRYIPILARQAGFRNIGEKVVEHHPRRYGESKYGLERMVKGYLDLITVMFLSRFGRHPMYFFGSLGTLMFIGGFVTAGWIIANKLIRQAANLPIRQVADQPLFYVAIVTLVLGVMLFLTGFLGELINRNAPGRNDYSRDREV